MKFERVLCMEYEYFLWIRIKTFLTVSTHRIIFKRERKIMSLCVGHIIKRVILYQKVINLFQNNIFYFHVNKLGNKFRNSFTFMQSIL